MDEPREWTEEEILELFERRRKEESWVAIAQALERTYDSVRNKWRREKNDIEGKPRDGEVGEDKVDKSSLKEHLKKKRRQEQKKETGITSPSESIKDTTEGNYRRAESRTKRIKTVEDLIKELDIDLQEWRIDRTVLNKWEVGRRQEKKHLEYTEGKADGYTIDTGEIFVEPLFQVKIWLTRRVPKPVELAISPVQIIVSEQKKPTPKKIKDKKALIIPDIHVGFYRDYDTGGLISFHDREAVDIVMQVAFDHAFSDVVYLGDNLDLAEWTDKFLRSPEVFWTTQPALIELTWILARIKDNAFAARHTYITGNHEIRMNNAVLKHLPVAYKLKTSTDVNKKSFLSVRQLLGLDDLGVGIIEEYPNGELWLTDELKCIHGNTASSVPGRTSGNVARESDVSIIMGHIHKQEQATRTRYTKDGIRLITVACPGCLCKLDGTVPGHKRTQHWQQGFGVVDYAKNPKIELVPIREGEAVYNNKLYKGRDYVKQLKEDTEWKWF